MASTSSLGASSSASAGVAASFYDSFTARLSSLSSSISAAVSADELSPLLTRLNEARHALDEATEALPARDRASHEARLRECTALLTRKRAELAPPTGFAFRRKTPAKPAAAAKAAVPGMKAVVPPPAPPPAPETERARSTHLSLAARMGEHLTCGSLGATASGAEVHLSDLTDCLVDLRSSGGSGAATPALAAMQLRRLKRCVVLLGHVAGAVMAHELEECLVLVECAQFRMHVSQRVAVLLSLHSSTSRATIEECSAIRFGAVPAALRARSAEAEAPAEDGEMPAVQDFDFPAGAESVNWARLDEAAARQASELLDAPRLQDVQQLLRLTSVLAEEGT